MCIYEVNLKVCKTIYKEFLSWLKSHAQEMLAFDGFLSAEILKQEEESSDGNEKLLTVHYKVDSKFHLEKYLESQAPQMRADSLKKFGDKFSATRRVFTVLV